MSTCEMNKHVDYGVQIVDHGVIIMSMTFNRGRSINLLYRCAYRKVKWQINTIQKIPLMQLQINKDQWGGVG